MIIVGTAIEAMVDKISSCQVSLLVSCPRFFPPRLWSLSSEKGREDGKSCVDRLSGGVVMLTVLTLVLLSFETQKNGLFYQRLDSTSS